MDEAKVWQIVEAFREGSFDIATSLPTTPEKERALVERWMKWPGGFSQARFRYPRPSMGKRPLGYGSAEVVVGKAGKRYDVSPGKSFEAPIFAKELDHWYTATVGGLDASNSFEATWALEKLLRTLPIYAPDFAYCEGEKRFFELLAMDPRDRVWPVMIYGEEMAKKVGGRERIHDAPAWKVQDLAGGRILVQLSENPFSPTRSELSALARHLDLQE